MGKKDKMIIDLRLEFFKHFFVDLLIRCFWSAIFLEAPLQALDIQADSVEIGGSSI